MKTKRFLFAICLLLVSATLLGTASFAWFSMNTRVSVDGIRVEAYSDSLFLEISTDGVDTNYKTEVDFTTTDEQALRLAKHGFVANNAYTIVAAPASGKYNTTLASNTYYKLVSAGTDSYEKYVVAEADVDLFYGTKLTGLYTGFTFALTGHTEADGTTTYYKAEAGKYVPVTTNAGDKVTGYYVASSTPSEVSGDVYYAGTGNYYVKGTDGSYSDVTATLKQGTDLSAFYTVAATPVADYTTVTGKVYLASTGAAANEYALLGDFATATDITGALYFGRAYSDTMADGDDNDTLSILKNDAGVMANYCYKQVVYLRNALNTNDSENLQATITVGGAANEIAAALRVLLVVTDEAGNLVNTVYYDNDALSPSLTYGEGTNIVDRLAGNKQEVLKVEIYVYFDGTDDIANNTNIEAGVLNGQTVGIEFTIDGHDYN